MADATVTKILVYANCNLDFFVALMEKEPSCEILQQSSVLPLLNLFATSPKKKLGIGLFTGYDLIVLDFTTDSYSNKITAPNGDYFYGNPAYIQQPLTSELSRNGELVEEVLNYILKETKSRLILVTLPEIPVNGEWFINSCKEINGAIGRVASSNAERVSVCDVRHYINSPNQMIDSNVSHIHLKYFLPVLEELQRLVHVKPDTAAMQERLKIHNEFQIRDSQLETRVAKQINDFGLMQKYFSLYGTHSVLFVSNAPTMCLLHFPPSSINTRITTMSFSQASALGSVSEYDLIVRDDNLARENYRKLFMEHEFNFPQAVFLNQFMSMIVTVAVTLPKLEKKLRGRPLVNVFIPYCIGKFTKDTLKAHIQPISRLSNGHIHPFPSLPQWKRGKQVLVGLNYENFLCSRLFVAETFPYMLQRAFMEVGIQARFFYANHSNLSQSMLDNVSDNDDAVCMVFLEQAEIIMGHIINYQMHLAVPNIVYANNVFNQYSLTLDESVRDDLEFYKDPYLPNELGNKLIVNEILDRLRDVNF